MNIRVLGCHGSELPGFHATTFLINESILLDAGAVTSVLSLEEQLKIEAILVSHAHLDHIKDIPGLTINIEKNPGKAIEIIGTSGTLKAINFHIFNDVIWPDFTLLPTAESSIIRFRPIVLNQNTDLHGLTIKAVPVDHLIEAAGYIIKDNHSSIIYTGDTGPTKKIWEEASNLNDLKAIFVETSFTSDCRELAEVSVHLTPASLKEELKKMPKTDIPIFIFHMKPSHLPQLKQEIAEIGDSRLTLLSDGDTFQF